MEPNTRFKRRARTSPTVLPFLALLLIAGCRDASVVTEPAPITQWRVGPLFISGVMTPQNQSLHVSRGGAPFGNAVVTVNGFPM